MTCPSICRGYEFDAHTPLRSRLWRKLRPIGIRDACSKRYKRETNTMPQWPAPAGTICGFWTKDAKALIDPEVSRLDAGRSVRGWSEVRCCICFMPASGTRCARPRPREHSGAVPVQPGMILGEMEFTAIRMRRAAGCRSEAARGRRRQSVKLAVIRSEAGRRIRAQRPGNRVDSRATRCRKAAATW